MISTIEQTVTQPLTRAIQEHEPGADVRRMLDKISGLSRIDGRHGSLSYGRSRAEVLFDSGERIRVRALIGDSLNPEEALVRSAGLRGNVRLAGEPDAPFALADTRFDGLAHLPATFAEIRGELPRAFGRARPKTLAVPTTVERESVANALDGLTEVDSRLSVVPRDEEGWEVRASRPEQAFTFRLAVEKNGLALRTPLIEALPTGVRREAVTGQALRANRVVRSVRCVLREDALVLESLLHGGLVESRWIAESVRALVAAKRHLGPVLKILSTDARVAQGYVALFGRS